MHRHSRQEPTFPINLDRYWVLLHKGKPSSYASNKVVFLSSYCFHLRSVIQIIITKLRSLQSCDSLRRPCTPRPGVNSVRKHWDIVACVLCMEGDARVL